MADFPDFLISKILLYNSHDCASLIRNYCNEKIAKILIFNHFNNKLLLSHPVTKKDISYIDKFIFRNSWFVYNIRYYPSEAEYGILEIINIDC